ncbi:glycerophosphoryl diester phosphodiesterase [Acanthocystis turfacea Chlorella virus MN0810.1]|nr:glycerophosphoryl diester phosphodiesterase [Acanthocystis turfacea Chlorella virus MN0810.1]
MPLISHRGLVLPPLTENTMATFRTVLTTPCRFIELDVRKTKDGVPVVFHDATLDRVAGVPGEVREMSWERLQQIELHGGEKIPSLYHVLSAFKDNVKFDIEIKSSNTVDPVLQDILSSGVPLDNVIITSFKWGEVEKMRKIAPYIRTGLISTCFPRCCIRKCQKMGANVAVLFHQTITKDVVKYATDRNIEIYAFTVNNQKRIKTLLSYGVSKIITDTPAALQ